MAESTEGGFSWTAFEVVLGGILLFALLSRLAGYKEVPSIPQPVDTSVPVVATSSNCAIILSRPKPLEVIDGSVSVAGVVQGCTPKDSTGLALTATLIDSEDRVLSNPTPAIIGYQDIQNNTTFTAVVTLRGIPNQKTGYLLIIPKNAADAATVGARTPVRFK